MFGRVILDPPGHSGPGWPYPCHLPFPLSLPFAEHIQFRWVSSVSLPSQRSLQHSQARFQMPTELNLQNSIPPLRPSFLNQPTTRNWKGQSLQTPLIRSLHPALSGVPAWVSVLSHFSHHPWHFPNVAASAQLWKPLAKKAELHLC